MDKDNDYVDNLIKDNEELKALLLSSNDNLKLANDGLSSSLKTINSCVKIINRLKLLILIMGLSCFLFFCYAVYIIFQLNSILDMI